MLSLAARVCSRRPSVDSIADRMFRVSSNSDPGSPAVEIVDELRVALDQLAGPRRDTAADRGGGEARRPAQRRDDAVARPVVSRIHLKPAVRAQGT
jgi:hypothetical protein